MTTFNFNDPRPSSSFSDARQGNAHDNPSLADRVINLSKELSEANDKIGLLTLAKNDMDQAVERSATWQKMYNRLNLRIENAATIIKDAIIADDIDKDTLKSVADELYIALTREVRIKIKIEASGTATVPIDFDLDDIDNEISVEFSNNYGTDVEFDIEVDDMSADCEDI
jgi:hypothetical protein